MIISFDLPFLFGHDDKFLASGIVIRHDYEEH